MLSYNDVLVELQDYMLDEENIQKSLKMKLTPEKNNKTPQKVYSKSYVSDISEPTIKKPQLFVPNQQDSLFWSFYIIKNGEYNYQTLKNKNTLTSRQYKIELVENIRKNKDIVKTYKFDTITNIESNLVNDNNLNVKTFLTLCAIENLNVVYVNKNTYYELLMNDTNIIYIFHELDAQSKYYKKYGFELATADSDSIKNIKNTLYRIDNIAKPIKAISAYNVQDLLDICNKLSIGINYKDTGKNKSKKDMYEEIIQYF